MHLTNNGYLKDLEAFIFALMKLELPKEQRLFRAEALKNSKVQAINDEISEY